MIAPEILINLVPLSRLYDLMQPSYDQICCFVKLHFPAVFQRFARRRITAEGQTLHFPRVFQRFDQIWDPFSEQKVNFILVL